MYRVSSELYKHGWKFGRTRNALGTRAAGECFHSFFELSQTFTSVCRTRQKHEVHVFYFFQKTTRREKGKQLVITLFIKMLILFAHAITASTAHASSVSPSSYTNTIFNQSAYMLSQDCFLKCSITLRFKQGFVKVFQIFHRIGIG